MTRSLKLRPRAEVDLVEIWEYTAEQWSEDQANNYLRELSSVFDLLLDHPKIARERCEFSPPVRIHPVRSHVIIYEARAEAVEVVRIVHSRSNWANLLSE